MWKDRRFDLALHRVLRPITSYLRLPCGVKRKRRPPIPSRADVGKKILFLNKTFFFHISPPAVRKALRESISFPFRLVSLSLSLSHLLCVVFRQRVSFPYDAFPVFASRTPWQTRATPTTVTVATFGAPFTFGNRFGREVDRCEN